MARVAAAVASVALACTATPASAALPVPGNGEWWFSSWDIDNKVWPISTGRGVTVAVLDTGINARLPDLSGVVLSGTDVTGKKDDGRIDVGPKWEAHGTGTAAMIAGQGPELAGVAPDTKILPVTVDRQESHVRLADAVAEGIRYAVGHGAKVISMSRSFPNLQEPWQCPAPLQGAVDYAIKNDTVLVAAAGDTGDSVNTPQMPAACPGVLAVGSVDAQGKPSATAQRQPYVAAAAPGGNTGSIGGLGILGSERSSDGAAALTAGAVALVRSKFPRMSARQVVQRIIASTRDVGPHGVDQQTGYGLLRPYHALVDQVPANAPNPVYARWDQTQPQKTVTPTPSDTSVVARSHEKSGGTPFSLIAGIVLGALCMVGGVVVFLFRRGGRREALE